MKSSVSGPAAAAVALAAALGLSLAGPHRACAAPTTLVPAAQGHGDLAVTILSPVPRTAFSGVRPVEISAFYEGAEGNQVTQLELYVDGVKVDAATKRLDPPETRGVVSFLIDASQLTGGLHRIVVRATAADAEVTSAKGSFVFSTPGGDTDNGVSRSSDTALPELSFLSPARDSKVEGTVKVSVHASDVAGHSPYISLFVDRAFKMLKNNPPYDYDWDTTTYSNGYHTVEILESFDNDSQPVAHVTPLRIYVNNPGGRTERRTDLRDAPKPVAPKKALKAAPKAIKTAVKTAVAVPHKDIPPAPRKVVATVPHKELAPALMAQAATHPTKRPAVRLAHPNLLAMNTPEMDAAHGLSDPFVPDAPSVKSAGGKDAATPVRGFKPLPTKSGPTEAPLISALRTGRPYERRPRLLRLASAALPATFAAPLLAAPTLPSTHPKAVAIHAAPAVSGRKARVAVHAPVTTANLQHSVGQTRLLFNRRVLTLERPITAQGSILFSPLRRIFEFGGGSLTWQPATGQVRAQSATAKVALTIGQKEATVNNQVLTLDAAPYLNQGRTMVPLSFLPAALDVNVQYDPANGHLLITSKH